MSYVISGLGVSASAAAIIRGIQPTNMYDLPPMPTQKVVQSTKPGPGAVYLPVNARQSTKPGPGAVYLPVPAASPQQTAPLYTAPAATPFDWKPWAIGAVVLGGGLYLLFR